MAISTLGRTVSTKIMAGALASVIAISGAAAVAQPAYADINDGTSQSVEFTAPDFDVSATLDKATLGGALNPNAVGYLYRMGNGSWYVCSVKDYISLDDLLAQVGLEGMWDEGASLTFTTYNKDNATGEYYEGVYDKYDFTYEALEGQTSFFDGMKTDGTGWEDGAVETVPNAALAFQYKTAVIEGDAADTAAALAAGAYDQDTRFVVGLSADNIGQSGDYNMGKRFPSAITKMKLSFS